MKKLSKEKRNQLALVSLLFLGVLAGLWFGLISSQQQKLSVLDAQCKDADQKLRQVTQTVRGADDLDEQLNEQKRRLEQFETGMASGDLYSWMINTLRQFKLSYKVEIPQFSQIDGPKDVPMLPRFPYKQATVTVSGSGGFHDFGRFLADFENHFPYMRVVSLTLEPTMGQGAADPNKLAFRMEIAALVKPAP
jgi:Tfp pilus assembly protein PilO